MNQKNLNLFLKKKNPKKNKKEIRPKIKVTPKKNEEKESDYQEQKNIKQNQN